MTFDWHMLYPLHTVIFDNSQVFGGVPCKAQLCNFSKWFFSPRLGVVPIGELWQFCYVRIEPPKYCVLSRWGWVGVGLRLVVLRGAVSCGVVACLVAVRCGALPCGLLRCVALLFVG